MNRTWLNGILAALCLAVAPWLNALGLGEIKTESALNEPLVAEITLINIGDLKEDQLVVGIGSQSDYELAGVTREFFHTSINFEVDISNAAKPRILVRSDTAVTEPYVNFIVQLRWPQGKLLREYTLLLDLPIFSRQQAAAPQAPAQQGSASRNQGPLSARQAAEQQDSRPSRAQSRPAPRAQTSVNPSSSGSNRQAVRRSTITPEDAYKVASGDTLWGIAGDIVGDSGLSRYQAMLSIHENNPNAFGNGDINRLQAGADLKVPSVSQMQQRSANDAFRDFSNEKPSATPLSAVDGSFRDDRGADTADSSGRLTLSSPDDTGSAGGSVDPGTLDDQSQSKESLQESSSETAALKEELDAAEIMNEELEGRVEDLEEQLEVARELVAEQEAAAKSAALAAAEAAQKAREELEASAKEEKPARAPRRKPLTFWEKVKGYIVWIIGGVLLLVVIAVMVVFMIMKRRKQSEELLDTHPLDDGDMDPAPLILGGDDDDEKDSAVEEEVEDAVDEDDSGTSLDDLEEGLEEDLEGELLETDLADEIFGDVSTDEDFEEDFIESEEPESEELEPEEPALTAEEILDEALPVDETEVAVEEDNEEFEAFAFEFPGIGNDDEGDSESQDDVVGLNSDEEIDISAELEEAAAEVAEGITFTAPGDEQSDQTDETSIETELTKGSAQSAADAGLDFGEDFGYKGAESFDDLSQSAGMEFEDSLEIHTPEIDQLLVPTDDDGLDDDSDDLLSSSENIASESEELATEAEGYEELLEEETDLNEQDVFVEDAESESIESIDTSMPFEDTSVDESLSDETLAEDMPPLEDTDLPLEPASESIDLDEGDDKGGFDLDEGMDGDLDLDSLDDSGIFDDDDEEFVTKLELAEAYVEIGDVQGARELLEEVQKDGNDVQKAAATSLLEEVAKKENG